MPGRGAQQDAARAAEASAAEDAFPDTWRRTTPSREKQVRRLDLANVSVNLTQLVAIVGLVWAAAGMYKDILSRMDKIDDRGVQMQAQMGEMNARLVNLERRP